MEEDQLLVSVYGSNNNNNAVDDENYDSSALLIDDTQSRYSKLQNEFQIEFGIIPDYYVRAPGRVNIIGEHIDYEGYSVLPMAIPNEIVLAISIPEDDDDDDDDTTTNNPPVIRIANVESDKFRSRTFPSIDPWNDSISNHYQQQQQQQQHDWSDYFWCGYKGAWLLGGSDDDDDPNDVTTTTTTTPQSALGVPMNIMVYGTIPPASGLSSSSAFVVASFLATRYAARIVAERRRRNVTTTLDHDDDTIPQGWLLILHKRSIMDIANLCCQAEQYIGTMGGGMDQTICCCGGIRIIHFQPTLTTIPINLPPNCVIVIANSLTKSEKAISAATQFNLRVVECTLAAKLLAKYLQIDNWKTITTLRQVQDAIVGSTVEQMEQWVVHHLVQTEYTPKELQTLFGVDNIQDLLLVNETNPNKQDSIRNVVQNSTTYKLRQRAQHVYSEAARVLKFQQLCCDTTTTTTTTIDISESSNHIVVLQQLGDIMNASQTSCCNLYECSCIELDELTSLCRRLGAYGSRLTGAGWGGCTVSLVPESIVSTFIMELQNRYYIPRGVVTTTGNYGQFIFAAKPSPGASIISSRG